MKTIGEIVAEFEKDPERKKELDRARRWLRKNREKLIADLVVTDLEIVDGRLVEAKNMKDGAG